MFEVDDYESYVTIQTENRPLRNYGQYYAYDPQDLMIVRRPLALRSHATTYFREILKQEIKRTF